MIIRLFIFENLCAFFENLCGIAVTQSYTEQHKATQRKI